MLKFTKKRVLIALSVVGTLAVASIALAFWTTSGSGNGSATAGSDAGVTVAGDPANGIYPGGNVAVTSTVTNSSSTQAQYVSNLHVTISIDTAHTTADTATNQDACKGATVNLAYAVNNL
jgi:hypothetical protein